MKITPNQDFLHGHDRYAEGVEVDVEPTLGYYAIGNGWAVSPDVEGWSGSVTAATPAEPVEPVELEPHDAGGDQAATVEG